MAFDQSIFAADFNAVANDCGVTFAWTDVGGGLAASGLTGVIGDLESSDKSVDPGFLAEFDLLLFSALANFGSVPARGGTITITGYGTYQIEKTIHTEGDPIIRLGLVNQYK